ncbi:MAG TPA: hypothetical protein PLD20_33870 [Blastocatellia bacterium]|nr:hypothetical protein [Blastocatellia bacterium]HMX27801.1 hypothetical protein [Blastocatellia bacterium]HMZ22961.1 hypothetical protein [Blastocatellia bacterium]HNG30093.1 hypothetical protein [Blastocatellia bacterium]
MFKTLLISVLAGIAGYIAGMLIGIVLVNLLSSNRHDRAQEAVMTGFFFVGPATAVLAFIVTLIAKRMR